MILRQLIIRSWPGANPRTGKLLGADSDIPLQLNHSKRDMMLAQSIGGLAISQDFSTQHGQVPISPTLTRHRHITSGRLGRIDGLACYTKI